MLLLILVLTCRLSILIISWKNFAIDFTLPKQIVIGEIFPFVYHSFHTQQKKALKKLVESLPYYQDKLGEKEVFKHFMDIISKVGSLSSELNFP